MDDSNNTRILTINAGSSSIKFDIYEADAGLKKTVSGSIEGIGGSGAVFAVEGQDDKSSSEENISAPDHAAAAGALTDWLKKNAAGGALTAVGHRIVHGGPQYHESRVLDDEVIDNLRAYEQFDPEHLPTQIKLIETLKELFPDATQVACFDTAFHHGLPAEARLLPIPRRYESKGVRRYGFHGLSCEFIMKQLDEQEAAGRVIIAHLGNGVSLTAVKGGKSIDTTMGLTPASGVPMSSRSGDIDPGLPAYLARSEGMSAEQFGKMTGFQSGLLGLSEISASMKELLGREADDERAKEAIDLFCYQVKKSIGGLAAALGGLDTLVFTGGMGEPAPKIRSRVCAGLDFLGIELDSRRNDSNAGLISTDDSRVAVRVIHTDESATIADNVLKLINKGG